MRTRSDPSCSRGSSALRALAASLACAPLACSPADGTASRPNVLLISLDSTRRDQVGAYGVLPSSAGDVSATPHVDELAREGVLFEAAWATSSWTLPSHVALLTGQPDLVHAVELADYRLGRDVRTLAERLRTEGYRTTGLYSGPYLDARFGNGRGFERYEACYGAELRAAAERARSTAAELAALAGGGAERALERYAAWERDVESQRALEVAAQRDVSSRRVVDRALAELAEAARDERPFLLFVHLFDPHYDYVPPPPFDQVFDPSYEGEVEGRDFFRDPRVSVPDPESPSGRRRTASERDLAHVRALHRGEVASTDRELGRLLDALDELGLARTTLVVVVADHGDEFFEHGGIGHRRTLYEEVLAVPLVMRLPAVLPAGRRVRAPVSIADVAPTVLELAGCGGTPELLSSSLLPAIEGDAEPRPGVLARLVRTEATHVRVQAGEEVLEVPVDRVLVTDAFRRGPVKVARERRWIRPPEGLEPDVLALLREEGRRQRAEESLAWIDLERFPAEPEEAWSSDFTDPRAAAALAEFAERYRAALERRARALPAGATEDLEAALRGLGYAGEGEESFVSSDELALPPPGVR